MEHDDILSKINSAKEQFYSDHQKNTFFKKQQKFDCATNIVSGLNENEVFSNVFAVNDDVIFFNYPLFKTVAHPEYYQKMADYLFLISSNLIDAHGSYRIFVNCVGMTVSAIERYKDFVNIVSKRGLVNNKGLLSKLSIIKIHNPPSFVDNALKCIIPLIDNNLWNKITIVQDVKK